MTDYKIGNVTYYYEQLGIAIVELQAALHVGERIRFSGQAVFSQLVESMQIDHEEVASAEIGDTVGIKTRQPVAPGDEVVKLAA